MYRFKQCSGLVSLAFRNSEQARKTYKFWIRFRVRSHIHFVERIRGRVCQIRILQVRMLRSGSKILCTDYGSESIAVHNAHLLRI
jgi:hypothetical protein